jgi:hypothetical protein
MQPWPSNPISPLSAPRACFDSVRATNRTPNSYARASNLGIAAKIKIMGEPSLVFTGLWFGTHILFMQLPSEKYKIASWKKNDFEDLNDLLVSFRLCFVIAEDSSCIFTMYYLLR